MPTELRRIVFTNDELRLALDGYFAGKSEPLPVGHIKASRFKDDTRNELTMTLYNHSTDSSRETELSATHMAASLIKYCMAVGIRLPRSAQKSIGISGDNIALDLRMEKK